MGDSVSTIEADFRDLEAFISPSASNPDLLFSSIFVCPSTRSLPCHVHGVALTLALASRVASASAAMDLCNCTGIRTSLISTRATRIPHSSVASSSMVCLPIKRKDIDQKTGAAWEMAILPLE
uniref:Uncharacterized protein n=1 Tax=Spermophilus dauricus TaxID=99837 RepID=A0A8C9UMK6_SPEDA